MASVPPLDLRMEGIGPLLAAEGAAARILAHGVVLRARVTGYLAATQELTWETEGPPPSTGPLLVRVEGALSALEFVVPSPRVEEGRLVTPLSSSVLRVLDRRHRRARAPAGSYVRYVHPVWSERIVERPLRDVSWDGLSFFVDEDDGALAPGTHLPRVEVHAAGDVAVVSGGIRTVDTSLDGGAFIGLDVAGAPSSRRALFSIVRRALHPTAKWGAEWDSAAWEVLRTCGYFELSGKQPGDFDALRHDFEAVSRKLEGHPDVGFRTVIVEAPGDRGEATMSAIKLYTGTWLGFQIGKRRDASRESLRAIYLAGLEPIQADPEFRWLMGYIEAGARWMRHAHEQFALDKAPTGLALASPFHLMEGSVALLAANAGDRGVECGDATLEEQSALLAEIARTRPAAYREALDLVPARIDGHPVVDLWATAGLRRERRIRVARADGKPIAAAVLDQGESGVSLFHLVDGMRLFPLPALGGDEELREAAFGALLADAARCFGARGAQHFVYFREGPDGPHTSGLTSLGDGILWIIASALFMEWLDSVYRLTAPRPSP